MKYSYTDLLHEEQYTKQEVLNAALVTHPKAKRFNFSQDELKQALIFENGSNLTLLETPIKDEYGNEYRCSE
jgi:hypothetical protein